MATNATFTSVVEPVPTPVQHVQLVLSEKDAAVLRAVLERTGGPAGGAQDHVEAVKAVLDALPIRTTTGIISSSQQLGQVSFNGAAVVLQ